MRSEHCMRLERAVKKLKRLPRRLAIWIPVIFNDEDFDYAFLLRIMHTKIGLMREHIGETDLLENTSQVVAQMELAEEMIEDILECNAINDTEALEALFKHVATYIPGWWS